MPSLLFRLDRAKDPCGSKKKTDGSTHASIEAESCLSYAKTLKWSLLFDTAILNARFNATNVESSPCTISVGFSNEGVTEFWIETSHEKSISKSNRCNTRCNIQGMVFGNLVNSTSIHVSYKDFGRARSASSTSFYRRSEFLRGRNPRRCRRAVALPACRCGWWVSSCRFRLVRNLHNASLIFRCSTKGRRTVSRGNTRVTQSSHSMCIRNQSAVFLGERKLQFIVVCIYRQI